MFEEGEWDDEASAAAAALGLAGGLLAPPVGRAAASRSHKQRKRLLATLHRLAAFAPRPSPRGSPAEGDSGASDSEPEQRLSRRKRQRRRAGPEPPGRLDSSRTGHGDEALGLPWQPKEGDEAAGGEDLAAAGGHTEATEERPRNLLTRKQWRNRQKNKRRQKNKFKDGVGPGGGEPPCCQPLAGEPLSDVGIPALSGSPTEESPGSRAASLRLRMEERLESARFRYINQQLYTSPSQEAAQLFREDPEAFAVYHRGFARQVAQWPENPVQRLVRYLRHKPASLVVADFGCGDCTLAHSIRNKVHCFDLVALDPRVTVCDMAQVPLQSESVDVAVFCLALMGTNLCEILQEASRVLKAEGTLLVAEVASRFLDLRAFIAALARLGFQLLSKDVSGSHFYTFKFRKAKAAAAARSLSRPEGGAEAKRLSGLALRPCLYKRR